MARLPQSLVWLNGSATEIPGMCAERGAAEHSSHIRLKLSSKPRVRVRIWR